MNEQDSIRVARARMRNAMAVITMTNSAAKGDVTECERDEFILSTVTDRDIINSVTLPGESFRAHAGVGISLAASSLVTSTLIAMDPTRDPVTAMSNLSGRLVKYVTRFDKRIVEAVSVSLAMTLVAALWALEAANHDGEAFSRARIAYDKLGELSDPVDAAQGLHMIAMVELDLLEEISRTQGKSVEELIQLTAKNFAMSSEGNFS